MPVKKVKSKTSISRKAEAKARKEALARHEEARAAEIQAVREQFEKVRRDSAARKPRARKDLTRLEKARRARMLAARRAVAARQRAASKARQRAERAEKAAAAKAAGEEVRSAVCANCGETFEYVPAMLRRAAGRAPKYCCETCHDEFRYYKDPAYRRKTLKYFRKYREAQRAGEPAPGAKSETIVTRWRGQARGGVPSVSIKVVRQGRLPLELPAGFSADSRDLADEAEVRSEIEARDEETARREALEELENEELEDEEEIAG